MGVIALAPVHSGFNVTTGTPLTGIVVDQFGRVTTASPAEIFTLGAFSTTLQSPVTGISVDVLGRVSSLNQPNEVLEFDWLTNESTLTGLKTDALGRVLSASQANPVPGPHSYLSVGQPITSFRSDVLGRVLSASQAGAYTPPTVNNGILSLTIDSIGRITAVVPLYVSVPTSQTDVGIAGQQAYDSTGWYICTAANSWCRVDPNPANPVAGFEPAFSPTPTMTRTQTQTPSETVTPTRTPSFTPTPTPYSYYLGPNDDTQVGNVVATLSTNDLEYSGNHSIYFNGSTSGQPENTVMVLFLTGSELATVSFNSARLTTPFKFIAEPNGKEFLGTFAAGNVFLT